MRTFSFGGEIEGVTHQALGNVPGTFNQTADLQIDPGAKLSDIVIGRQGPFSQRCQKARGHPPKSPRRRSVLRGFDLLHRRQHLVDTIAFLRRTQPGQQPSLETRPFQT